MTDSIWTLKRFAFPVFRGHLQGADLDGQALEALGKLPPRRRHGKPVPDFNSQVRILLAHIGGHLVDEIHDQIIAAGIFT
jgi:hypothetical protein